MPIDNIVRAGLLKGGRAEDAEIPGPSVRRLVTEDHAVHDEEGEEAGE